jgi:uncharacterized protein
LAILAGTGHLLMGNVNYVLLLNLLLGSIPGIVLGSYASTHAPERIVRSAISFMIAVAGVKMLFA